jgi:uncharacterized membrane protein
VASGSGSVESAHDDPDVARTRGARRREDNEIEFSRIVAFSDGVFAIAITLLVLNLEVPIHLHGKPLVDVLWGQRERLFAYALSFAVIGRFWVVHHRFFSDVVGFDGRLLGLNLFYLSWIVLIPFTSQVLGEHGGLSAAVILYAVNMLGVTLVGLLMTSNARRAGLVRTDPAEERILRRRAHVTVGVFLGSIPIALVAPAIAPFIWLGLFFDPASRILGDPGSAPDRSG